MTHKDIYTKFMIEYDKANVTSSYPSLTEYEVATILDKAYDALIAQKITGNNLRRVAFEGDLKAVTDLYPLIKTKDITATQIDDINVLKSILPDDCLYFINANLEWANVTVNDENEEHAKAYDGIKSRKMPIKLVSHEMATKFIASSFNIPWVKQPVCYIENDSMFIVYDSFKAEFKKVKVGNVYQIYVDITYIKTPKKFAKELMDDELLHDVTFFDYTLDPFQQNIDVEPTQNDPGFTETDEQRRARKLQYDNLEASVKEAYTFECNSTVAEELISLAIAFALENVESQRLNSKLNMRGLEA